MSRTETRLALVLGIPALLLGALLFKPDVFTTLLSAREPAPATERAPAAASTEALATATDAVSAMRGLREYLDVFEMNALTRVADELEKLVRDFRSKEDRWRWSVVPSWSASRITSLSTALKQAASQSPGSLAAVDPIAQRLADQLTTMAGPGVELHEYYRQQDYQDDGGARGQALYERIEPTAKGFVDDVKAFNRALDQVQYDLRKGKPEYDAEGTLKHAIWTYYLHARALRDADDREARQRELTALRNAFTKARDIVPTSGDSGYQRLMEYDVSNHQTAVKKLDRAMKKGEEQTAEGDLLRDVQDQYDRLARALRESDDF